ncbi:AMP phosphorylase [Candidatus Woesearchaeota archaeon]|nr:AMP phosphorylase [Candidatus Woesearchaeota archaeon]
MKLKVKDLDIATGGSKVVLLNQEDADKLDLHHMDRIRLIKGKRTCTAVLDIAESRKAMPKGKIGLFEEVLDSLKAKQDQTVTIKLAKKPKSIQYIRKKLDGKKLSKKEIQQIIHDIVKDELTSIELTTYIIANYTNGMSSREILDLTKVMTQTGTIMKFEQKPIADLHSIGGVPGNRITMIIVPILVAAGLKIPKTSTRAITSPSGTADTMELLTNVTHQPNKLKEILKKAGGFIVWGGAVDLAPADDKIIKVESPLSIDAEGQMLASIMSKKASVGAKYLLLEIPLGPKVKTRAQANKIAKHFRTLAKNLKIKIKIIITDGSQPIGNGIGPALEARDCLWLLQNHPKTPKDLKEKSLRMSGQMLEYMRKTTKGYETAKKILETGKALETMHKIIKAQGGTIKTPEQIIIGNHTFDVTAKKTGKIKQISNSAISKIARVAGAPKDTGAGIYLFKHVGDRIKKGETIYTIHAENKIELEYGIETAKSLNWGIKIGN